MIRQIAWNTFKNTGDINTFLEYKEVENLENNIRVEKYENINNQGNSNSGKSIV